MKEGKHKSNTLEEIREGIMEAMGRISSFWGFSKIMGQLYGLLYLSFKPLTLDDMAESLSVSKGNVSINIRTLERWNMVKPVWIKGDRKDFYEAETDFWKIVKGVLREREKKEFDQALSSVSNSIKKAENAHKQSKNTETALVIEQLKRCNLHCTGCSAHKEEPIDLEPALIGRIISESKNKGTKLFVLAGGEPFLRHDILSHLERGSCKSHRLSFRTKVRNLIPH